MKKLLLAATLSAALAAAAQFQVIMPTAGLSGQAGTIDIQFNPGSFPAIYAAGTATISAFSITGGMLGSVAFGPDGGAVGGGSLPGSLAITNVDFLNGIGYNATFGSHVMFLVDFTGAAFTSTGQSILTTFSVNLSAGAASVSAIADLPGGSVLDTSQSSPGVIFDVADIPEPSTWALMTIGLGALVAVRRCVR